MPLAYIYAGVVALTLQAATPGALRGTQVPATPSVAAITAAAVARHVNRLASDSMQARETPSPGLERRTQYVAAEFQRIGLKPVGDSGGWFQRYPVPGQFRFDATKSMVSFMTNTPELPAPILSERGERIPWRRLQADFATAARLVGPANALLRSTYPKSVVLLTGRHRPANVRQKDVRKKVVLYVPPVDEDSSVRRQMADTLRALADLLVIADDQDSAHFAAAIRQERSEARTVAPSYLVEATWERSQSWMIAVPTATLAEFVDRTGIDLTRVRATSAPQVLSLPRAAGYAAIAAEEVRKPVLAPNVVGVLEGSDPKLKRKYVVVSARLDDAAGSEADGVTGTAGLVALAEAFRQSSVPLRRSLLFVGWSGGDSVGWGNNFFAENYWQNVEHLSLAGQVAVALRRPPGTDAAGGAADSAIRVATVDGLADITLPLGWVVAAHPELGLDVRAGTTSFRGASLGFPFARKGIPTLAFHAGNAVAGPQAAARLLDLMYYVIEAVANADEPLRWSPEGLDGLSSLQWEP